MPRATCVTGPRTITGSWKGEENWHPNMDVLQNIISQIRAVFPAVRYVAHYRGGKLTSRQRSRASDASVSESDRYEELFVNLTGLTLARQPGCCGAQLVLVRYGNFYQLVLDLHEGHVSLCMEVACNPLDHANVTPRHLWERIMTRG
jgi:hypothetical protein